jgi:hypothetical protein
LINLSNFPYTRAMTKRNDETHSFRIKILAALAVMAFAVTAEAKGPLVTDLPQQIPRAQAKRLFVVGYQGSVTVSASKTDDVSIKALKYGDGEDSTVTANFLNQFAIRAVNSGDTVEVRALPTASSQDWSRWVSGKHAPEVKLEISAPPGMSLEIFWTRGDVKVTQWKAPVFITSQDGHITVENDSSDLTARTMFGSLKVENVKGNVSIENFASQLFLNDITGHARVRTFSGETHLKKIVGPTVISSQKGIVTTSDTLGGMDIQSGVAPFHILDHKGSLVGHSDGGSVSANIRGPVDVRLVSVSGPLTVSVSHESSASVNLSTKGQLNAPKELEKKSGPDAKIISGELQGNQPGHLRLSSDTGDLNLRVL